MQKGPSIPFPFTNREQRCVRVPETSMTLILEKTTNLNESKCNKSALSDENAFQTAYEHVRRKENRCSNIHEKDGKQNRILKPKIHPSILLPSTQCTLLKESIPKSETASYGSLFCNGVGASIIMCGGGGPQSRALPWDGEERG
ncbi:hypothetical protein CDAR_486461 [Caerostris darwini]|uniref:Uncharacterized protein n=1 Tax=Caerostris darwini TaxID=1538125 RepID=A0AAV4TPK8_9ARAC|nr:hypothetical protein CDAR_486461 [Caerostris darwini]